MSSSYSDFIPLTKSAGAVAIEKAVQAFFVAVPGAPFVAPANEDDPNREKWTAGVGGIAFYTNFNELVFQACRPRVRIRLHSATVDPYSYALDDNSILREKSWSGQLDFGILTEMNYAAHTTLRSVVDAIIPQILPQITADNSTFATTGINALLANFQVSKFSGRSVSTDISEEKSEAAYYSGISCDIAFGVNPAKWPPNMETL